MIRGHRIALVALLTALVPTVAASQTPPFKTTYLQHGCRAADVGMLMAPSTQKAPEFSLGSYVADLAKTGCNMFHWGGSTWADPEDRFSSHDPYWYRAGEFIDALFWECAHTGCQPGKRWIFNLAEVISDKKFASEELGYTWLDASPDWCMSKEGILLQDGNLMFRHFYPTKKVRDDGDPTTGVLCNQPGGCECSDDPSCKRNGQQLVHYCMESSSTQSVPSVTGANGVTRPATKAWWLSLAEYACWARFTDFDFSVAFWSANLDQPSYDRVEDIANAIKQIPNCAASAVKFSLETLYPMGINGDGNARPSGPLAGEIMYKRSADLRVVGNQGYYAAGCSDVPGLTGAPGDLCIPRSQFTTTGTPAGGPYPFIELDTEERWRFLRLKPAARKKFIQHSMRSAKQTYGRAVPAYFWPPAFGDTSTCALPGSAGYATAPFRCEPAPGGWKIRWREDGYKFLCPNAADTDGAVFPVKGVFDSWNCGYAATLAAEG